MSNFGFPFRFPADAHEKAVWLEKLGLKEFTETVSKLDNRKSSTDSTDTAPGTNCSDIIDSFGPPLKRFHSDTSATMTAPEIDTESLSETLTASETELIQMSITEKKQTDPQFRKRKTFAEFARSPNFDGKFNTIYIGFPQLLAQRERQNFQQANCSSACGLTFGRLEDGRFDDRYDNRYENRGMSIILANRFTEKPNNVKKEGSEASRERLKRQLPFFYH
ncbi:hypothetical protein JTB14_017849 [Gonioctena quinquepunctata]|nr:hypothetical protein JTB14_017849 [Gonioctena quinquepunctata]